MADVSVSHYQSAKGQVMQVTVTTESGVEHTFTGSPTVTEYSELEYQEEGDPPKTVVSALESHYKNAGSDQ